MSALQLVWFKRDLRTVDHRPLVEALKRGPVLPLYVVEPELWQQPDTSERPTWQSHSFSQLQNNPARQSKQQRKGQSTLHDERRAPQAPSRDLIRPVTKPNPGEAHQLLSPNRQSNNGCRQSNLCNQQPIEQAQHQHPKDAKAQLKQSKTKAKTNNPHQRLNGIALHELL